MKRKLTLEDLRLWESQMKDVKPLLKIDKKPEELPSPKSHSTSFPRRRPLRRDLERTISFSPLLPLDRKELRRVKIEARLDLHGMTLEQGYKALETFLLNAQERGIKTVLIITGKGAITAENTLRHQLPKWLSQVPLRHLVSSLHHPAKPHEGGTGAFYVRIKRRIDKTRL